MSGSPRRFLGKTFREKEDPLLGFVHLDVHMRWHQLRSPLFGGEDGRRSRRTEQRGERRILFFSADGAKRTKLRKPPPESPPERQRLRSERAERQLQAGEGRRKKENGGGNRIGEWNWGEERWVEQESPPT